MKQFEHKQGAVEDPLSIDRVENRVISFLRPGMRCTLCYEARCSHCSQPLQLADYLWDDVCMHCGMSGCPHFLRREIRQPTWIEQNYHLATWDAQELWILSKGLAKEDIIRLAVGLYALYRTVNTIRFAKPDSDAHCPSVS